MEYRKRFSYKILLVLFLFSFGCNNFLCGQHKKGVLTYHVRYVNGYGWKEKLAENTCQDSVKTQKVREKIEKFLGDKKGKKKEGYSKWQYHFDKKKARIIGNNLFRHETFDLYFFEPNERIVRRFHKGNEDDFRIDTVRYSDRKNTRTYKTNILKDSITHINGYECYKVEIEELRELYGGVLKTNYELYLTKRIEFPFNPLIEFPLPLTKHCPVKIISWSNDEKRNYMEYILADYTKKLERKMLRVPKKYRRR